MPPARLHEDPPAVEGCGAARRPPEEEREGWQGGANRQEGELMDYFGPALIVWLAYFALSAAGVGWLVTTVVEVLIAVVGWTIVDAGYGKPFGWWWGRTRWR